MKNETIIDLHYVRHTKVSQVIERELSGTLQKSHRAVIITGRSTKMQEFVIESLAALGFSKDDMIIMHDKIKVYW